MTGLIKVNRAERAENRWGFYQAGLDPERSGPLLRIQFHSNGHCDPSPDALTAEEAGALRQSGEEVAIVILEPMTEGTLPDLLDGVEQPMVTGSLTESRAWGCGAIGGSRTIAKSVILFIRSS